MAIGDLTIDFTCPDCHQGFQVGLHQLWDGGLVICPRCRATNAETELAELERDLNGLGRSLQICREATAESKYEDLVEAELGAVEHDLKGLGESLKNLKKCLRVNYGLTL